MEGLERIRAELCAVWAWNHVDFGFGSRLSLVFFAGAAGSRRQARAGRLARCSALTRTAASLIPGSQRLMLITDVVSSVSCLQVSSLNETSRHQACAPLRRNRLYRDHTVSHDDWPWVKDLSRLGRDLARVVIVDDNPLMFMYQPDNALHVAPYDPQVGTAGPAGTRTAC